MVAVGNEPDGFNINAGVGATHTEHLPALCAEHHCDVAISLDGDADRCIAVDENGRDTEEPIIFPEWSLLGTKLKRRDFRLDVLLKANDKPRFEQDSLFGIPEDIRPYLSENPVTKEYESLKLLFAKRYKYNRDEYTRAKSDFVLSCTNKAKMLYPDRYL